jgi:hypothetical protein
LATYTAAAELQAEPVGEVSVIEAPLAVKVKAIVGGPPWIAVLSGLPGVSGDRVVRIGDRFDAIQVRDISATTVEIAAPDSLRRFTLPGRDQ